VAYARGRKMWDVLWDRMLCANAFGVDRAGLSGIVESVVSGVKIFTRFNVVSFGGKFAVVAEESLLVVRERLRVTVNKGDVEKYCRITKLLTLIFTLLF
jgi:hypothetical protein